LEFAKTVEAARRQAGAWKTEGCTIGLVPTMGYLHDGHASLIRRAAADNDKVVVSVFVNPMQFGVSEDLAEYPRDIERDGDVCRQNGVHLLFSPDAGELYPDGFCSFVDMSGLTDALCGRSRPALFRGVCTVVAKLFHIIQPHTAYFGQKDAQQLAIIRRMTADLNLPVNIVGCPVVREPDGLALSSRNKHLNPAERKAALCLSAGLAEGRRLLENGETDVRRIKAAVRAPMEAEPLARVDYAELVDADGMRPAAAAHRPLLCAAAVFIGATRLIDNFILDAE
jgi:pantoate--beta-alanine ligase